MGSAASWQIQSQRKAQSVFFYFEVEFNPWIVLIGEQAGFLGLFFLPLSSYVLCRARFLPGQADKYTLQSNLEVYPNSSRSEAEHFGRSRALTAAAPLNGPAQGNPD